MSGDRFLRGDRKARSSRMVALAAGVLTVLMSLLTPVSVSAHALLVSSTPDDGSRLGLAPGAVVFNFSENLNQSLSQATVTDPNAQPVTARAVSARQIRVDLLTNAPGSYTCRWFVVSADDGHTTQGTITFTVLANGGSESSNGTGSLSLGDLAIAALRWVEDLALLTAVGTIFITWLARKEPQIAWAKRGPFLPLQVAAVAGPMVIAAQALAASGGDVSHAVGYLLSGPTGFARIARVLLEWYALFAVSRRVRIMWPAVTAPIVALAASGHAFGNDQFFGIALDSAHIIAAGVWAGGIVAMARLRPDGGWRLSGLHLLRRFSRLALVAFSVTVILGLVQAVINLGSFAALFKTDYGHVLVVKVALIAAMIPLSVIAWRLRRPRMRTEASIAVAVIAAAALLGSTAVPSRSVVASGPPAGAVGLPHGSDLTLGDHAGSVLVGMTLFPATPGPNKLIFYMLPPEGASAAALLDVSVTVAGRPVIVASCGDPCREATVSLLGGESVQVAVAGSGGGASQFSVPPLPAPDASTLLSRMATRMHGLRSYAMHETLTSGGPTLVTDYQAIAPSSLEWTSAGHGGTISIGTSRYSQQTLGGPWTREDNSLSITEPAFVWDNLTPYSGVHVIGSETMDGVPVTVVGFFGGSTATPVWLRLWIDDQRFVHRAQMRAPGHFMDETFSSFDAVLAIVPPTGIGVASPSP